MSGAGHGAEPTAVWWWRLVALKTPCKTPQRFGLLPKIGQGMAEAQQHAEGVQGAGTPCTGAGDQREGRTNCSLQPRDLLSASGISQGQGDSVSHVCPCRTRAIGPAMRGIPLPNPSAGPGRDRRVSDTAQPPGSGHACPRRGEKRHQGS